MTRTNQAGNPVEEESMFKSWSRSATDQDRDEALTLLAHHLGMEFVMTNATKHGIVELELRKLD